MPHVLTLIAAARNVPRRTRSCIAAAVLEHGDVLSTLVCGLAGAAADPVATRAGARWTPVPPLAVTQR